MVKQLNGKVIVAAGVALAVVGLLMFSLTSPATTLGQEADTGLTTDVPVDDDGTGDVGAGGIGPPSALPDTGTGAGQSTNGSTNMLLVSMLAALGVALTGAGVVALRQGRAREE